MEELRGSDERREQEMIDVTIFSSPLAEQVMEDILLGVSLREYYHDS